jgi:hypothetical protein
MLIIALIFGLFASGFFVGYTTRHMDEKYVVRKIEKDVYCNGYEDGFYFGWGEYDPESFRIEIAEKAYQEYKGLKHGPEEH